LTWSSTPEISVEGKETPKVGGCPNTENPASSNKGESQERK